MKASAKILLAAGLLGSAALVSAAPASAQPFGFSFRMGDVSIAYQDGYYDRYNRWHYWRGPRERAWYRANYGRHFYRPMRHDQDRDGIPDRFDRDRDNDGVPNFRDRNPYNPYR